MVKNPYKAMVSTETLANQPASIREPRLAASYEPDDYQPHCGRSATNLSGGRV